MRKLLVFLSFAFTPLFITAQTFPKAPKDNKPIKQITEWTTFAADEDDPEETIKDAVYVFRRDGQLQTWVSNNSDNETYHYEYDGQNRLKKVNIKTEGRTRTMAYQYFDDRRMAEIEEKSIDLRSIQYFNKKGQLVEEKSFWKGELTGGKWATDSRAVFNYNAQDSLFGEMVYEYKGAAQPEITKVVHAYHPVSNKKTKTTFFDINGKPWKEINFSYTPSGDLGFKETKTPGNGFSEKCEYLYRYGKKWQVITTSKDYKFEKVYKEGRLVRSKEYDKHGKQLWYTDYQYEFF